MVGLIIVDYEYELFMVFYMLYYFLVLFIFFEWILINFCVVFFDVDFERWRIVVLDKGVEYYFYVLI